MCKQFKSATESFELGEEFAKYNQVCDPKLKMGFDACYDLACKEARDLDVEPPEPIAFRMGFESISIERTQ